MVTWSGLAGVLGWILIALALFWLLASFAGKTMGSASPEKYTREDAGCSPILFLLGVIILCVLKFGGG